MTSRILLADDSPHAQRMGERILREEGYEVISATDGEAALAAMDRYEPDVVLADVFLPLVSGYELCRRIKTSERFRASGVILIAGLLEPVDEEEARLSGCRPLIDQARFARGLFSDSVPQPAPAAATGHAAPVAPQRPQLDPETVRAAVTLALDRSLAAISEEITEKVLLALGY